MDDEPSADAAIDARWKDVNDALNALIREIDAGNDRLAQANAERFYALTDVVQTLVDVLDDLNPNPPDG